MLLSDSPQAGTTYSRTIADKSRFICGLWCEFYDNGTACRTGVYAAVAVGGVSAVSLFSIILFTLSYRRSLARLLSTETTVKMVSPTCISVTRLGFFWVMVFTSIMRSFPTLRGSESPRLSIAESGVGLRVKIRISFKGNSPCSTLPTGASRKLCGHLHDLDGFGTNQLAVQKFKGKVADAVYIGKLLGEGTDADRAAAHDPVIAEITESDRLAAGLRTGHKFGNADLVTQNGIIGMIPDVVAGIVLEGTQSQCGLIIHEPSAVLAVLGFYGEEQLDHIIVGDGICGHTDICAAVLRQNAGGHIYTGAVDEAVVLGSAEVLGKTLHKVVLNFEVGITDERVLQFEENRYLVALQCDFSAPFVDFGL